MAVCLPEARSSRTIWRMKSVRIGASVLGAESDTAVSKFKCNRAF